MNTDKNPAQEMPIGCIVILGVMFCVLITAWPFLVYYNRHHQCVRLQNGLNLGYEAVFDLSRSFWMPIAVAKFPDGTPLLTNKLWAIYVTNTTVYGVAINNETSKDLAFVWRADTGLVLEHDDKNTYERLVSEAGEANPGLGSGSIGTQVLMREYMKKPEHADQRCRTKLITW